MIDNNEIPSAVDPTADYSKMLSPKMPGNMLASATDTGLSIEPRKEELSISDQAVNEFDNQRQDALNTSFMSIAGTNPDKAAENQRIANQIGVGQDIVSRNEQESKKRNDIMRLQAYDLIKKNAVLADLMTDPNFASVAHTDASELMQLSDNWKDVEVTGYPFVDYFIPAYTKQRLIGGFARGEIQNETKQLFRDIAKATTEEEANRIEAQKFKLDKESEDLEPITSGWIANPAYGVAQFINTAGNVWSAGWKGALVGGGAAGVLSGANPIAAGLGAIGGGIAASAFGYANDSFESNAGEFYFDLRKKGYDRTTSMLTATVGGTIMASIDVVSFGFASAFTGKALSKLIQNEVIARIATKPVTEAVAAVAGAVVPKTAAALIKPSITRAVGQAAVESVKGTASEITGEVSQDAVQYLSETITYYLQSEENRKKLESPVGFQEFASQLVETAVQTMQMTLPLQLPGSMIHIYNTNKSIQQQKLRSKWMSNLKEKVDSIPLTKRSPTTMQEFIAKSAEGTNASTVYIDGEELAGVLNQLQIPDEEIDSVLPGVRAQMKEAIETGGDVKISIGEYITNVGKTPVLYSALEQHIKIGSESGLASGTLSAKQAIARQESMQQDMKDAQVEMAVQEKVNAQFVSEAKEIEKVVNDQLVAAGRPPTEAAFAAKLVQARAVTGAARDGITPAQWVARHPVPKMQSQQQAAQAAQQAPAQDSFEQAQTVNATVDGVELVSRVGEQPRTEPRFAKSYEWKVAKEVAKLLGETGKLQIYDQAETGSIYGNIIFPDGKIKPVRIADHPSSGQGVGKTSAKRLVADAKKNAVIPFSATDPNTLRQELSTRRPSSVTATEDPLTTLLTISHEQTLRTPEVLAKNVEILKKLTPMRFLDENATPEQQLENFLAQASDNLVALYNLMPPELRDRAKLWYPGGRRMLDYISSNTGLSPMQVGGVFAVLSPQKDWYENVTLGNRIIDIVTTQSDFVWDDKMSATAAKLKEVARLAAEEAKVLRKAKAEIALTRAGGLEAMVEQPDWNTTEEAQAALEKEAVQARKVSDRLAKAVEKSEDQEDSAAMKLYDDLKGTTLKELLSDPYKAAVWVRVFDQTFNEQSYKILLPEGGVGETRTTQAGKESSLRWAGYGAVAKAISVIVDGRAENVFYQIGNEHKVRNFYNNLFAPESGKYITIDTHAVAAANFMPLAGTDDTVAHAFGGSAASGETGQSGAYSIYFESYRRAAEAVGVLPREMQSITWEAVRGLFEASKKKTFKPLVKNIWEKYKSGELTQEQAREEIIKLVGGITNPSWAASAYNESPGQTYEGVSAKAASEKSVKVKTIQKSEVLFEVAPDPTDANLSSRWDALDPKTKHGISADVAAVIVPEVLKEFGVSGEIIPQVGGWQGKTNPGFALRLESGPLTRQVAKALGHALSQQGMFSISAEKFEGSQESGLISIQLPDGYTEKQVGELYEKLWKLEHNGKQIIQGHSTIDGKMAIINDTGIDTAKLADMIDKHLGGAFEITETKANTAFDSKDTYGSNLQRPASKGISILGTRRIDSFRQHATRLIDQEVTRAEEAAGKLNQSAVPATFYSALSVEVGKSTTKSAIAEGWKQQIKGLIAKGVVKEKEVYWSGLDNWLDLQEGKITKEQVQEFLDTGGAKVERKILIDMSATQVSDKWVITSMDTDEMTLFDNEEGAKEFALELAQGDIDDFNHRVVEYQGSWYVTWGEDRVGNPPFGGKYKTKSEAENGLQKELQNNLQNIVDSNYTVQKISEIADLELRDIASNLDETINNAEDEGASFGDYQLPGGDNYREVIVTLADTDGKYVVRNKSDEIVGEYLNRDDALSAATKMRESGEYFSIDKLSDVEGYRSGHFPKVKNPVVHVRLNDFVDTDGNKVMVVNEVQSDWGQEGREKGFVDFKEKAALEKEGRELVQESALKRDEALQALENWRNARWEKRSTSEILDIIATMSRTGQEWANTLGIKNESDIATINDYIQTANRSVAVDIQLTKGDFGIPAAPFVESTGGWLELGLKQILLEAVNGGYDKVAFVDGDQSVERYRNALTEKVDEIEIFSNEDGTYTYKVIKDGGSIQSEISANVDRMNEVFGKSGSKQLREQADANPDEIHTIASSNIEIGGEGMRKFYDKIVPQALNKMLKKLGGDKIEEVKLVNKSAQTLGVNDIAFQAVRYMTSEINFTELNKKLNAFDLQISDINKIIDQRNSRYDSDAIHKVADEFAKSLKEKPDGGKTMSQQGFTVTPALAEQVSQGLPLFQAAEGGDRGEYNPIKNLIEIGSNADYSTVAHELAHWYVVDLFRTASDPAASKASKADADILLNWFGIAGDNVDQRLANWNAMTLDEQRRHHEAVAYNWELYLHTGKAPSVELQGVFDRFRRWLTRAYESIRDDLNKIYKDNFGTDLPFLTDEVRGVFDRMLASEEQISRREAIDNFKGMYQTQAESGMNDATWAAYQAEIAEAHEMAVTDLTKATVKQMEWLSGARKGILKAMQAAHNALRRSVQGEEADKMDNEPVRKAERFFKTGKMVDPDGKEIEVLVGNKIDSVAVGGMYPTSTTGLAPAVDLTKLRGMTMEGGLAPDLAAEMFGFSSGDQLIRALAELKPFKDELKERTDARMLDEHGGMNTEAEKEEAVNKALANEVRARIVAIENRYLTKVKTPVAVIMQGAKELARTILGRMAIKDIKPRNYVAAEARVAKDKHTAAKAMQSPETAGKSAYTRSFNEQIAAGAEESAAASEALVKSVEAIKRAQAKIDAHKKQYGDVDPAIVAMKASHQQVIQGQLAKEGYKILEEVEKQVSLFKRFFKDDKKIAATRNMDLVNAARSILAFYGLGKHDKLPGAYLKQIQEYNPGLFETISAMVNEAQVGTPDYESLTFEEFQSMQETVDALWQLAKRENQIKIEGEMVSLGQATEKLEQRMDVVGVPTTIAGETQAVTSKDRAVRHINSMKAILRRVEHWADSIDGAGNVGGPFTKYIWRPISQALDAYRIDRNKYVKRYVELLKQVPLPAGKIAAPELNYTFGAGNGGIGIAELLGAIMHSGNISNLEKLLIGRKWATVSEDGTVDTSRWDAFVARVSNDGTLTKEHFDFIQAVWDLNEEIKPIVQKAHYDIEGYYFKEVEATPFTNRFGTYRGGYVPAKTDPFIVRDAQRQAKMSELESDFRAAMPSTGAGFTKSRVKYNKALSLDIRLMAKHIDDVIRYSHVQPAVKDVLRILKKSSFADKLTQMDPMAIDEMLTPWLNRAARQITSESGRWKPIDTFWRTVRSRTGISVMIGNITNALQQVTGLFMSSIKVKPAILGNALYAYFSSPRLAAQEVAALSPFMSNRMENQIFDLQDQMNQLILNPNKFQKIQKWSSHHGYFLQSAFQNMVDVVTWTGAYNQYLAESGLGMSDADAQREAVNRADAAVRLTQGTMNPEGLAAFEVGTPFYKTFVQFTGYFNMLANLNTDEYVKIFRDLGWRGNEGKLAYTFLMGFAAQAIISDAIVRTMRGGWEDEDDDGYLDVFMDWIFGSMARSAVAMVPFGSSAYTALTTAYNNKPYDDRITSSPSISALESSTVGVGKAIINVVSEDKEITGQNVKDVMTLISLTTGIPVTLLGRPVSYLVDVNRGKVEPTSTADYMRGLITGTATKESKNR